MDINKFTEKAREAVTQAQSIAVGMGHQDIDSEHLALALIRQEQGIVPRILDQMGVQTAALAVAVEEKLRKRPSVSGGGMDPNRISITQRLAKVLGDAEVGAAANTQVVQRSAAAMFKVVAAGGCSSGD